MATAALIYPHQLYADHPAVAGADSVLLVEDPLYFTQYPFHRQKLVLHRASMARYAEASAVPAEVVPARDLPTTGAIVNVLQARKVTDVRLLDPHDNYLVRRLTAALSQAKIRSDVLDDPHFLTPPRVMQDFVKSSEKLRFAEFYTQQRKRLNVLLDDGDKPRGGKWSFDAENRKKIPAGVHPPRLYVPPPHAAVAAAQASVLRDFPDATGDAAPFRYPTCHAEARAGLGDFVDNRLAAFGDYEDAIRTAETTLFHSVLTPALNTGLLTPAEVVQAALAREGEVPLNSLEGFVRQVIGWREYVRLVYRARGSKQRRANFWGFTNPMPAALYDGTTGIDPVDRVVRNVLRTGYAHHIERLMILGNFMLLCEIDPDAVYQWFMELFVDAYDWVMVPNVYGMSQYADGGTMTTKPYISGSAYVLKMSDHRKGDWCKVWDALYWRFVDEHAEVLSRNPRTAMVAKTRGRLGDKLGEHRTVADEFLSRLHGGMPGLARGSQGLFA